ncbi:substrate-binding domain-containing protein [Streptomyces capitiformicae]|uniref:HTH lacI-type domain-containing protein n=1 Tax=Streptomyces capitiformicae TaxID=2014920 RepID=A0A918ZRW3_9ACTN|nr:substrate-binding domain-containing protein [Streptomyces capitiformicae]GHE67674.1 hypothetical protein GCM10017771_91360 [Streptomyces capitiformicae]
MVTIFDVARHAGASSSTVSYVLNGTRRISCEGTFESTAGPLARILADRPRTTGFVVQNEAAIGPLLSPLHSSGRSVPADASVVALCPEQLAEQHAPALTAVSGPTRELGRVAVPGSPALTRHRFGTGQGWYLSTRLDDADYGTLVGRLVKEGGVEPDVPGLPAGVEAVTRRAADGRRWDVLINHATGTVPLPRPTHDLLTGTTAHELPPGGCAVLRGH